MRIELKPGETIEIGFAESDGEIFIDFTQDDIIVRTDWPDSTNRQGVIYQEHFSIIGDKEIAETL